MEVEAVINIFEDTTTSHPIAITVGTEQDHHKNSAESSKFLMPQRIVWKNKCLKLNEDQLKFRGSLDMPVEIQNLQTPFEFFMLLFTEDLINHITKETIRYSIQQDPNKPIECTEKDIRNFLGICLVMSYDHKRNTREYWSPYYGIDLIKDTMCSKRFEKIRQFIHFANNDEYTTTPNHDRLFKIRPVMNALIKSFKQVPMEECLSIDEQMCATKGKSYLKQYVPSKPNKWGYKLFVLCGISGYAYDFEVYSGQENDALFRPSNEPDLGASSNVVVRLCRSVERNVNHKVFFDNYFTSLKLIVYLQQEGIQSLGTVRSNRIPNNKMPSEKDMKDKKRGESIEIVTDIYGVGVSCVAYKDNKVVTLMSSFVGKEPVGIKERFDKKEQKRVTVACPNIIKQYNQHMGGVDLLDSMLGRHKNKMKSRKYYMRLFYHMLDMCAVNAWLLYRKIYGARLTLAEFRGETAEALCKYETKAIKRGRPSNSSLEESFRKKRGPSAHIPVKDVRLDGNHHWPIYKDRQRCKIPSCTSKSYIYCSKCGVNLCLNKEKNCFKDFHNN